MKSTKNRCLTVNKEHQHYDFEKSQRKVILSSSLLDKAVREERNSKFEPEKKWSDSSYQLFHGRKIRPDEGEKL